MKKRTILISLTVIVLAIAIGMGGSYLYDMLTLKPHWVYLCSSGGEGRTLTVFYPKWFPRNKEMYIIPGRYAGTVIPTTNYVKTYPHPEGGININWQPGDGRILKFEYPLIGVKYEDHLDTSLYKMYEAGAHDPGYIDKGDSFYVPKYGSYSYAQWMLAGYREGPF